MERIIDVYYDRLGYPFKDRELTARFPVVGSEFLGASQTTTIRFHYEQIGTDENVYTVESKRPDGKTGSQLLSKNTTEHYAEMSLSGWYSECKGDLFLSLKVYRGGTTATYNETTQLWEVSGVPVIESTGAIKLAINYTPMGRYENYNDAISTYQDVLAALGDKLDTIKGIVGVSGLSQVDTTEYEEGQLFFDVDTKNIYKLESGEFVKINNKLEIVDVSGQTYQALFDKYGTQPFMSYFGETNNISVYQFKEITGGYELHCSSQKNGLVHIPSVVLTNTFSTSDFTQLDFQSAPVVVLTNEVGTLSDLDYEKVLQPNATISYSNKIYTKNNEDEDYVYFANIDIDVDTTERITVIRKRVITLTKSTQTLSHSFKSDSFYDTVEIGRLLSQKQDKLVSGTNIKTINNISLLGSGNIDIQGGGGDAEWGSIGGDIADQTDLQNELQEVREIATGRTRSAIISYLKEAPTEQTFSQRPFYDLRGNRIETWSDFVAFVNGRTFANSKFNSQSDDIEIDYDEYIIFDYHTRDTVYRGDEEEQVDTSNDCLNEGDIIIVKETTDQQGETIPDRWVYISDQTLVCSKLETSKVNLDNYSTKSETSTEVNKVAHDIAVEYDENTLYGVGDLCIKDKLLYKCNTNNTTGTWDSTKWDLTTINSELGIIKGDYVDLTSAQTITGIKTFSNGIKINLIQGQSGTTNISFSKTIRPEVNNDCDLGLSNRQWKDLYLSGGINPNTNGYKLTLPNTTSWTADKEIATTEQAFNVIKVNEMTDNFHFSPSQLEIINNGKPTRIEGSLNNQFNNVVILSCYNDYSLLYCLISYANGSGNYGFSYITITKSDGFVIIRSNAIRFGQNRIYLTTDSGGQNAITINGKNLPNYPASTGTFVDKMINGIWSWESETPTSVSLSDGGTITDDTLKSLVQREQPIKLNGFTCYFSCDDGTNYQYVSTRYDAVANKNHINVITIDKSTWVATFHTSDIAI